MSELSLSSWSRAVGSLAAGTSRVAIASAMMQAATLCTGVLVANAVGVTGFGIYSFVLASANAAVVLIQSSLGLMATRYAAEFRDSDPGRAGQILHAGALASLAAGVLAAAVLVAYTWFRGNAGTWRDGQYLAALAAMAAAVPLAALAQFYLSALTGLEHWRAVLRFCAGGALATLVLSTMGALALGPAGACWGIVAAGLARCAGGRLLLRWAAEDARIVVAAGETLAIRNMFRHFALPAFLMACTFAGSLWFASVHLLSQPDGARHLGLYAAVYTLRTLVVFLPAQLGMVSLPVISRHRAAGETREYRRVLLGSVVLAGLSAAFIACVILWLAPVLLPLFGSGFAGALHIVNLVMAASVLEAISTTAFQHLTSGARMWRTLAWVSLPRDLVFVVCVLLLVPTQFERGIAFAFVLSQATMLIGIACAQMADRRSAR